MAIGQPHLLRWPQCAPAVKIQVERFTAAVQALLGANLAGVYLHGSLAMGCPNPAPKDIDLLVVTHRALDPEARNSMSRLLLAQSGAPRPIELHVLVARDMTPWRHPAPYDLHFSEYWRPHFEAGRTVGPGLDPDLAAHLTILQHRGVALYGPRAAQLLPPVPPADYRSSILYDFESARDGIFQDPVYGVLNLCRVYWYLLDGTICSKAEAGAWGLTALPPEHRAVVALALSHYESLESAPFLDPHALERFATYIDDQVKVVQAR